ncbi:YbjQ family protein [Candidatus Woesearchaeota archaeon]|nr:YbjQ family protein [Candidatus Woesearchaeota archaeon]
MEKEIIISTTDRIPNKTIIEILGVVKGNTIRARWFGRDIAAGLKMIVGGEIKGYTKMIADARDEAIKRMTEEAEKLKADAVVNIRFTTSTVMQGAAEILAYGTAVKLK